MKKKSKVLLNFILSIVFIILLNFILFQLADFGIDMANAKETGRLKIKDDKIELIVDKSGKIYEVKYVK